MDHDWGFEEGRQWGRGGTGGQVSGATRNYTWSIEWTPCDGFDGPIQYLNGSLRVCRYEMSTARITTPSEVDMATGVRPRRCSPAPLRTNKATPSAVGSGGWTITTDRHRRPSGVKRRRTPDSGGGGTRTTKRSGRFVVKELVRYYNFSHKKYQLCILV